MDEEKQLGGGNPVKSKHPVMNVELGKDQVRPTISDNAFIYLQDRRINQLRLVPFVDFMFVATYDL